ncbi:hypothetical protein [Roseovarius amoyensis]|uniref:hypothetical protein n=1 Tax=Roseovarius amoyensis TaxID=2211448 RepID=UPI000DBE8497|nr:hypothetical protein [Roseovarius amoyensis]
MELIADILLIAGALGAGAYCYVLSQRLRRFNDLEKGVGGAVAVLSAQVDDLTRTLGAARSVAGDSTRSLEGLTDRAETVARRLELLVASMHDIPQPAQEEGAREPARPILRRHEQQATPAEGQDDGPTVANDHPDSDPPDDEAPAPAPVFLRHTYAPTDEAAE